MMAEWMELLDERLCHLQACSSDIPPFENRNCALFVLDGFKEYNGNLKGSNIWQNVYQGRIRGEEREVWQQGLRKRR